MANIALITNNVLSDSGTAITSLVSGSGTTNYLPKFTGSTALGNSIIYDDGTAVGIGTTSPTAKLTVVGAGTGVALIGDPGFAGTNYTGISLNNTLSTSSYNILSAPNDATLYINRPSGASIRFREANGTDQMIIQSGGNVGIGISTPGVKFVNSGATLASGPTLGSGTVGSQALLSANGLYGLYYGVSSSGDVWQQVQRNDNSPTVYNLLLQPSGGNVGIGTTSPLVALDVRGTVIITNQAGSNYDENLRLPQSTSGYAALTLGGSIAASGTSAAQWTLVKFPTSNNFSIRNNNSDHVTVFPTGNFAIGNSTDAGYKLDVNGTTRIQNTLTVSNPSYTGSGSFYQAANSTTVIAGGPASENITFGPSNRIFLNASQVRIPIGSLQIASTLSVGTTNATGINMIWANGSITAGSNIARGIFTDTTLVASANNDVLVGLDVTPTFTNGAFTGVINYGIRTSGDIAFASAANRYLTMQSPSTSGSGGNMIIQSASANTSGTGGNLYLYVGGGAGGPGPGKIYIGNNNGWDVAYVTGILTVSSTGPNTGDVLRVSGGGRNALTIAWDNLTPFMSYALVSGRQSRFLNSSSYYFDNNFLIGTTTDGGYKLSVNGNGNFILGNSGYIRLQSGSGQRHGYIQSAFSNFLFSNNIYYDGSNWRYDQNGYGAQIQTETLSVGVIAFNTFASGTAGNVATIIESMRIVNNGNILMGTTTDSGYKLDVNGTSRFTNSISLTGSNRYIASGSSSQSVYITGGTSYLDGAYFNLTGNTYGASPGAGSAEFVIRTNSDSKFALFGYNGSSWSRYMTLFGPTGNLNIGSGTTDSGYKLRIEGNTYNDGEIISVGNITTNASAYVNANAQGYNLIVYPNTTSGPNNLYSGGQVQANIYTSSNGNAVTVVPSTSQVVMAWYPSTTQGVFIDYTIWIYGGADAMRSGTFMVVNDAAGNVQYTDIATPDLNASTALATLVAANNGGVMEVTLNNGSGNVVFINTVTRYIPTMV
jgi:hypothetical protein